MKDLTPLQSKIFDLASENYKIVSRFELDRLNPVESDMEEIVYWINARLADQTPAYAKVAKDGVHVNVFSSSGRMLICNKPNADQYKHLTFNSNVPLIFGNLVKVKRLLIKRISLLKKLPSFKNGNFYKETEKALSYLIRG